MSHLSRLVPAVALVAMLASPPAIAQAPNPAPAPGAQERAEQALREGAAKILRALEILIGSVPQYEMPEIQKNGDIIIRRKHPAVPPAEQKPATPRDGKST